MMTELTIHLSEEAHHALLVAAESRGRSVGQLVLETLKKAGLCSSDRVAALPGKARAGSTRSDEVAIENRRILDRLNEVYADGPSSEERDFQKRMLRLQREQLAREPW